ncbi:MAG: branched-chain-amino-acid transaminase [Planctomycetaceae bacterium]|jgi:branched-chain amino acid aminotransferase|nr:branched-chain-amino-acid transaminase [Planctomycetaceae bacterium]
MSLQIYIDGKFYDKENAKISVFDHGVLYGDGVFEGLRSYNGKVFRLEQHIDRLWDSAKSIALDIPMSKAEMIDAINQTTAINNIKEGYIRVIITRGVGDLGLDPFVCVHPQVIIIAAQLALYPKELYEKGLDIVTASTMRTPPAALNPRIKSLNYLNNIMAKVEASRAGCEEALILNHKGEVAECTGDNIFIVRNGELLTPPIDAGILEGITRNAVLELAKKSGIVAKEIAFTRHDVYVAEECFLTGSGAELIPVVSIDKRIIGNGKPGTVTKKLLDAFHEETKR